MALAWTAFAARAAWVDFAAGDLAHWGLGLTSVYLLLAGISYNFV